MRSLQSDLLYQRDLAANLHILLSSFNHNVVNSIKMFSKSLALASVLSTAIAGPVAPLQARDTLPNVEIKALPAGCASYPDYNADTKVAGPWSITVAAAENPALFNYGTSTSYSLAVGSQGPVMRWGHVSIRLTRSFQKWYLT